MPPRTDNIICWKAAQLPSQTGSVQGETRLASSPENGAGFLTYGPYINLTQGCYKATLKYTASGTGQAPIGFLEAGAFGAKSSHLGRVPLMGDTEGRATLEFEVPGEALDNLEIRTFFEGKGQLAVHSLSLESLVVNGIVDTVKQVLRPAPKAEIRVIDSFEALDLFVHNFTSHNTGNMDALTFARSHVVDINPFIELFGGGQSCANPLAPEYGDWEIAFFEFLSGRSYNSNNEGESLDLKTELAAPPMAAWPLGHKIAWLRAYADLLEIVKPQPKQRILEMGCGYGNLIEILGRCGCEIFAIEASRDFADFSRARLSSQAIRGHIHNGSFYDVAAMPGLFDLIFFEASFHHCGEPVRLLTVLREKIAPDGRLIFFHEPIEPHFDRPWGVVRYDGESMLQIRLRGWLELGYRTDFFEKLLVDTGWCIVGQQRIFNKSILYEVRKL